MMDRSTKERKLIALMITDLELNLEEPELIEVQEEVRALPDEELDKTLASRLDLPFPVDEQAMERAVRHIEEPNIPHGGEPDGTSGATDMSDGLLRPEDHEE